MSARTLPSELDDIILDHLHDDHKTLASTALVCRSWLPTSRHHLWHAIHLTFSQRGLERLRQLLCSSPHLVYHVRSVALVQDKRALFRLHERSLLFFILTSLPGFPALSSLTLSGLSFQSSFFGRISLSSIRRLSIAHCAFVDFQDVVRICSAFPNLATLHLDNIWWERCSGVTINALPAKLAEVSLGDCFSRSQVIDWLLDALPAHTLHTLRLPIVSGYDIRLPELLAAAGSALLHFDVGSPSASDNSKNYR